MGLGREKVFAMGSDTRLDNGSTTPWQHLGNGLTTPWQHLGNGSTAGSIACKSRPPGLARGLYPTYGERLG